MYTVHVYICMCMQLHVYVYVYVLPYIYGVFGTIYTYQYYYVVYGIIYILCCIVLYMLCCVYTYTLPLCYIVCCVYCIMLYYTAMPICCIALPFSAPQQKRSSRNLRIYHTTVYMYIYMYMVWYVCIHGMIYIQYRHMYVCVCIWYMCMYGMPPALQHMNAGPAIASRSAACLPVDACGCVALRSPPYPPYGTGTGHNSQPTTLCNHYILYTKYISKLLSDKAYPYIFFDKKVILTC